MAWPPPAPGDIASERQDGLVDDLHRLPDLVLLDHQRRREPDDVAVRRLGQKPVISQPQAHLPSIIIFGVSDDNGV